VTLNQPCFSLLMTRTSFYDSVYSWLESTKVRKPHRISCSSNVVRVSDFDESVASAEFPLRLTMFQRDFS